MKRKDCRYTRVPRVHQAALSITSVQYFILTLLIIKYHSHFVTAQLLLLVLDCDICSIENIYKSYGDYLIFQKLLLTSEDHDPELHFILVKFICQRGVICGGREKLITIYDLAKLIVLILSRQYKKFCHSALHQTDTCNMIQNIWRRDQSFYSHCYLCSSCHLILTPGDPKEIVLIMNSLRCKNSRLQGFPVDDGRISGFCQTDIISNIKKHFTPCIVLFKW